MDLIQIVGWAMVGLLFVTWGLAEAGIRVTFIVDIEREDGDE